MNPHGLQLSITNRLQLLLWQSCPYDYALRHVSESVEFIMKEFKKNLEEAIDQTSSTAREICDGNKEAWEGAELAIALLERELNHLFRATNDA